MNRSLLVAAVLPALFVLGCSTEPGSVSAANGATARGLLIEVVQAMQAEGLQSISLAGRAWTIRNGWMQTPHANPPWPWRDEITNYRRTIDLVNPAALARGDTYAQNLFLDPAVPGTYVQEIKAGATAWSEQLEIWLTPWGFLKGAEDHGVELSVGRLDGVDYQVLSWQSAPSQVAPSGLRYTVNGYINDQKLVAAVETWVEDEFMGDFHILQVYHGYREIDAVMVPQTMEQIRGGGGVFGAILTDAKRNPTNLTELMVNPQSGDGGLPAGGAATDQGSEPVRALGPNVWLVNGAYRALVAEFEDYLLVFEAGMSEVRGEEILAAVTALRPGKPIRYLVNSHPHSDHTGGIVPFIRNGTALLTHANNVDFLTQALTTPRTLLGEDTLEPKIIGVEGATVYQDSMNRVELHSVPNRHTDGMLVAVLPRQGILFQADFTLPAPGAEANPFVVTLAHYVAEVDPDFERYIAVHRPRDAAGEQQTKADLLATIGL